MVEGILFIGAIIAAVTEAIRVSVPKVNGAVTIGIAALVGLLVALVDTEIGVTDLSVAQGIMTGLATAGTVTIARNTGLVRGEK